MNKSERLNDMMIYLNDKDYFNLKDLMEKYHISKSTALRDIHSLEIIGMPIYSEYGRNGRYGILNNRLLSPIIFTIDEMYSLYFAMLTLRDYQNTPFHLDLSKLKLKFESCISSEHIENLKKMENIFSLATSQHPNNSPLLREILESAINNDVSTITYVKNHSELTCKVQFFDISSSFGQWYVTAYNYETRKVQVFRCDKIVKITVDNNTSSIPIEILKSTATNIFRNDTSVDFEIHVTSKGVDLFFKEHYPSMSLYYKDEKAIIKGFYNEGEEHFISNYLISYGKEMLSVKPLQLKELIIQKTAEMFDYYKSISTD